MRRSGLADYLAYHILLVESRVHLLLRFVTLRQASIDGISAGWSGTLFLVSVFDTYWDVFGTIWHQYNTLSYQDCINIDFHFLVVIRDGGGEESKSRRNSSKFGNRRISAQILSLNIDGNLRASIHIQTLPMLDEVNIALSFTVSVNII